MPINPARKVEALRADFRSAAQIADLLGVNRAQITRWLRGKRCGYRTARSRSIDLALNLFNSDTATARVRSHVAFVRIDPNRTTGAFQ